MDFSLTEEQELLQDTVRGFVAKECPPQTVRAIFDGERQAVPALWTRLAEIGIAGLVVPEAHGGAGLELLELALVAEELGRGAVPVPFLGHALATLALARGGSAAQQAKWLPQLAAGTARASVALAEAGGCWLPQDWQVELANGRVQGRKVLVPEAEDADVFVVGCRGGSLVLVEAGAAVRITQEPTLDRGRPLATGIFVSFHASDSGYDRYVRMWEGGRGEFLGFVHTPLKTCVAVLDRAISDTMAALVCHGVFDRFPGVRVACIENGSRWVRFLFERFELAFGQQPKEFRRHPIETFRQHIWVAPFYEEPIDELAEQIGVGHVLFGSDYPHPEGLADPLSFLDDLSSFGPDDQQRIMGGNLKALLAPL